MSKLAFTVFGRFKITAPNGEDITPRNQKGCGLLAILLTSPENERSRAQLQDLLWSNRAPEQGSASLRQTLFEVRKALGAYRDVIVSERRVVRLLKDALTSDLGQFEHDSFGQHQSREFLDGLDINDPEFEDWVRDKRTEFVSFAKQNTATPALNAKIPSIFLFASSDQPSVLLGNELLNSIAKNVSEQSSVAFRRRNVSVAESEEADFRLEAEECKIGPETIVRLQLIDVRSRNILWQTRCCLGVSDQHGSAVTLSMAINTGTDRVLETLANASKRGLATARFDTQIFSTIEKMFQTRGEDFEFLQSNLSQEYERDSRGSYLALQAFNISYLIGERRVTDTKPLKEEARELIIKAVQTEPHNSLVLALASHIYSFVLGEFSVAHELANRSITLDRSNVLGWIFLGSAKIFLRQFEEGFRCISFARKISGQGPYRYLVDFFASMSAVVTGRLEEGVRLGQMANAFNPDFAPSLRYLIAGQLLNKDFHGLEESVAKLRVLESDFQLKLFAEPDYPVPALRQTQILDVNNLPSLL